MTRVAGWMLALVAPLCSLAFGQDVLVFDDGSTGNGIACLMPVPPSPPPAILPACPVPGIHFLVQGKRAELEVFNRRFLTNYTISIDAVTQIQTGPNIRNLSEAENLTLGAATLASIPAAKGGTEGLTARSADSILLDLVNEVTAAKPLTDLDNDFAVLERENARITAQISDFDERYNLLMGVPVVPPNPAGCQAARGSPSIQSLGICVLREQNFVAGLWVAVPYLGEQQFRDADTRVKDLIKAVKDLGHQLTDTDLPRKLSVLETAVSQYENDVNVFRGNAQAAHDAAMLALQVNDNFLRNLRREQLKALLLEKLKGPDSKPVLDEAEMNALLDNYGSSYAANRAFATQRWTALRDDASDYLAVTTVYGYEFRDDLSRTRGDLGVVLPQAIAGLNAAQGELLNRMNEIYDRSQVREPLPVDIVLKGHPGNLVVYYTIRRIETFHRFTVAQVQGPASAQASQTATPLPQAQSSSSGAQPSPANGSAANTNGSTQNGGVANEGIVVAKGSFEVHDIFHANVVGAFVFSTLKDQSISKFAQPLSCSGNVTSPDASCFSPYLNGYNRKWAPIVGLDYYFQPRDTFPRRAGMPWLCRESTGECFGIMGAASVTSANNYYLGGFFEPVLGVQFGVGANFGTRTVLDGGYKFGTPVEITGDFPTHDERAIGLFFSAGLDLGIFRKVFGKVTGIGTSASGTSGK